MFKLDRACYRNIGLIKKQFKRLRSLLKKTLNTQIVKINQYRFKSLKIDGWNLESRGNKILWPS